MKDLNELLKIRATKKLQKEISDFISELQRNKFFGAIEEYRVCIADDERETLRSFLWNEKSTAGLVILEKWMPDYIENEAKDFMGKVEMLEQEINELKNY